MTAIISTTFDDKYLFYLPINTWCWNRLNVGVVCFMPVCEREEDRRRLVLVYDTLFKHCSNYMNHTFTAPEHKQATYAQCARLFGGALGLLEDEVLVVSDIDMLVFNKDELHDSLNPDSFYVLGKDLVPHGQIPMCYISAKVKTWRNAFSKGRSYQECLDDMLAHEECENMRGNLWSRDQETAYNVICNYPAVSCKDRARPGTQFARDRIDRDDAYFMDRLSPDIIDYHCHRPGYEDENFQKILSVIQYFYPNEDLAWMIQYQQQYKALINE